MILHLIRDGSYSHVVDSIALLDGYRVVSCLADSLDEESGDDGIVSPDGDYGIWFKLLVVDSISVNFFSRQIEWWLSDRVSSVAYFQGEEYDIDLDQMFEDAQKLSDRLDNPSISRSELHRDLVALLFHYILPQVKITRADQCILEQAVLRQEHLLKSIDERLNSMSCEAQALRETIKNFRSQIIVVLRSHPPLKDVFQEVTELIIQDLKEQTNALNRQLSSGDAKSNRTVRNELRGLSESLSYLQKRVSRLDMKGNWKKKHQWLIEAEWQTIADNYKLAHQDLSSTRKCKARLLQNKVKANYIKESIHSALQDLAEHDETYGYEIQSVFCHHAMSSYEHSLADAVLAHVKDVASPVGKRHLQTCDWIIEEASITELHWKEDPTLIPSGDIHQYEDGFLILPVPDVFSVISQRISEQCAFTAGALLKSIPRIQPTPYSTRNLILMYESILFERIWPYILSLLTLRYETTLNKMCDDMKRLSLADLDVEEEWICLLNLEETGGLTNDLKQADSGISITAEPDPTVAVTASTQKVAVAHSPELPTRRLLSFPPSTYSVQAIEDQALPFVSHNKEMADLDVDELYSGDTLRKSSVDQTSDISSESSICGQEVSTPTMSRLGSMQALYGSYEVLDVLEEALSALDASPATLGRGLDLVDASQIHLLNGTMAAGHPHQYQNKRHTNAIPKNRSQSLDTRSRSKDKLCKVSWEPSCLSATEHASAGEGSSGKTPPLSPRSQPVRTAKEAELVMQRQRSRRSRASSSVHQAAVASVGSIDVRDRFKECVEYLQKMNRRSSPLEKCQMLAKALQSIEAALSKLKVDEKRTTCSDDLVTLVIIILMTAPTSTFRMVFLQLKFIQTFMDEFLDAGIHNFALVQFIGAVQFIQDRILTKLYKHNPLQSSC